MIAIMLMLLVFFAVLALLPAYLIVIAKRRIMRLAPSGEVPKLHIYSLGLQSFCYGSFVFLALFSQTARFSYLMTRNTLSIPSILILGLACIASLALGLVRGPLRNLLVTSGLLITLDLWMLMFFAASGMAQF